MIWKRYAVREQLRVTEIISLFETHREYKYNFPGEVHDFWECLYVLNGELCVSADERVYELKEGEIIFHKPMELHKLFVSSKEGADIFIFAFSADGPLTDFMKHKVFYLTSEQRNCVFSLLDCIRKNADTDESIPVTQRYLLQLDKREYYSQFVAMYIEQLVLLLANSPLQRQVSMQADAKMFENAVRYMNDSIYGNLSVEKLAKYCNMSLSGIKRLFYKFSGLPVHRYFLMLKMQKATELLKSGKSVGETADVLAFCNQAYFSKAYKRETGHSPSDFKEK